MWFTSNNKDILNEYLQPYIVHCCKTITQYLLYISFWGRKSTQDEINVVSFWEWLQKAAGQAEMAAGERRRSDGGGEVASARMVV